MLLSYDSSPKTAGLLQDQWQALHLVERLEMVVGVVQSVHAVLVVRHAGEYGGATRGAAAHCGETIIKHKRLLGKLVQIWRLAFVIAVGRHLKACIISYYQQNVLLLSSQVDFFHSWCYCIGSAILKALGVGC